MFIVITALLNPFCKANSKGARRLPCSTIMTGGNDVSRWLNHMDYPPHKSSSAYFSLCYRIQVGEDPDALAQRQTEGCRGEGRAEKILIEGHCWICHQPQIFIAVPQHLNLAFWNLINYHRRIGFWILNWRESIIMCILSSTPIEVPYFQSPCVLNQCLKWSQLYFCCYSLCQAHSGCSKKVIKLYNVHIK